MPTQEPSLPPPPPPPPRSRVESAVYHPPVIHRDPQHIHPMVTRQMASQAATLSATEGEPQVSPVPSSVKASMPLIRVLVINDNGLWINDFI